MACVRRSLAALPDCLTRCLSLAEKTDTNTFPELEITSELANPYRPHNADQRSLPRFGPATIRRAVLNMTKIVFSLGVERRGTMDRDTNRRRQDWKAAAGLNPAMGVCGEWILGHVRVQSGHSTIG